MEKYEQNEDGNTPEVQDPQVELPQATAVRPTVTSDENLSQETDGERSTDREPPYHMEGLWKVPDNPKDKENYDRKLRLTGVVQPAGYRGRWSRPSSRPRQSSVTSSSNTSLSATSRSATSVSALETGEVTQQGVSDIAKHWDKTTSPGFGTHPADMQMLKLNGKEQLEDYNNR